MRIVFMGTPSFSIPAFSALLSSNHDICAVYTQPPRKSGRGHKINNSIVHNFAIENNLEVQTPRKLTKEVDACYIKNLNADLCIVVAYGLILPESILKSTKLGCYNIHASLLPRWRGAAPIQRSLMFDDKETGITIMKMNRGLDTGNILSQKKISISKNTTFTELEKKLSLMGAEEILQVLDNLVKGKIREKKQDQALVTYAKKIEKNETKINWQNSAEFIDCQVRALSMNPGAWTIFQGKRLKIFEGSIIKKNNISGEVVDSLFTIGCGEKSYRPKVVQIEGKKIMDISEFMKGVNVSKNIILDN